MLLFKSYADLRHATAAAVGLPAIAIAVSVNDPVGCRRRGRWKEGARNGQKDARMGEAPGSAAP
jgi:hypothetical protein